MSCINSKGKAELLSIGALPGALEFMVDYCPNKVPVILNQLTAEKLEINQFIQSLHARCGNTDISYLKNNNATNMGYMIHGADFFDVSGYRVAVGDVNGDGVADIIIGAYAAEKDVNGANNSGETYVIYGKSGVSTQNIDISYLKNNNASSMGYIIHGADANDFSGYSVAVGDVNGDGIADIIIGAYGAEKDSGGEGSEGETYVIYGKLGESTQNIDISYLKNNNATNIGYMIHGADEDDESGSRVVVGDVNGDGVADIIIGAYGAEKDSGGEESEGETYVIYGKSGVSTQNIDISYLKNNNATNMGYMIHGVDQGDVSGASIAVGDVNGDGVADIIIGASAAEKDSGGEESEGETYVIYGKSGVSTQNIDISYLKNNNATNIGYIIHGADKNDFSGVSVSVGDINGDGIADIIIGAQFAEKDINGEDSEGETYVIYGRSGVSTQNTDISYLKNNNATSMGFIIHGADEGDRSGFRVSVGDVNGDGIADIIIGAQGAEKDSGGGSREGETYVIYGELGVATQNIDISSLKNNNAKNIGRIIHGADVADNSGTSIAVGDVNNDGIADIIIGAQAGKKDIGGSLAEGETYVIYGQNCPFFDE